MMQFFVHSQSSDRKRTENSCEIFVILYKGDNFWVFLFAYLHIKHLLKGAYYKRKEFAPMGSKFFPFIVGPFFRRKNYFW